MFLKNEARNRFSKILISKWSLNQTEANKKIIKSESKIDLADFGLHRDQPPVLELKFYKNGVKSSLRVLTIIANMFCSSLRKFSDDLFRIFHRLLTEFLFVIQKSRLTSQLRPISAPFYDRRAQNVSKTSLRMTAIKPSLISLIFSSFIQSIGIVVISAVIFITVVCVCANIG